MSDIIMMSDGEIAWHANGWPVPNPYEDAEYEGYSAEGMPDDIFDIWLMECQNMSEDWGSDE